MGVVVGEPRQGVDEVLVVGFVGAACGQGRLAMGFGVEAGGTHVGDPDLDRPQPLPPQPVAVLGDPVAHWAGIGLTHTLRLHVTGVICTGVLSITSSSTVCDMVVRDPTL